MDKVMHFEIPADDMDRAKKFYKSTFGWQINDMPEFDYSILMTTELDKKNMMPKEPGAINGGMMKRSNPLNAPNIVIGVKSIEEAAKTIEKNGGKMVKKKQKVGDMGFSAYFKDTEGNVIGLWQYA